MEEKFECYLGLWERQGAEWRQAAPSARSSLALNINACTRKYHQYVQYNGVTRTQSALIDQIYASQHFDDLIGSIINYIKSSFWLRH